MRSLEHSTLNPLMVRPQRQRLHARLRGQPLPPRRPPLQGWRRDAGDPQDAHRQGVQCVRSSLLPLVARRGRPLEPSQVPRAPWPPAAALEQPPGDVRVHAWSQADSPPFTHAQTTTLRRHERGAGGRRLETTRPRLYSVEGASQLHALRTLQRPLKPSDGSSKHCELGDGSSTGAEEVSTIAQVSPGRVGRALSANPFGWI